MAREQRRTPIHRQRSLASLATGFVFGILAAAGVGAIFYSQSNRDYLSEIAARIWDETNRRALKTGAVAPEALHEDPSRELNYVQPTPSEKPLNSTQQPEDSSVGANAAPIVEASKTGPSPATDAAERPQEKQAVKNDKRNEETIKTAAKGTTSQMSARDRLEFDVHRAIAKHAIRGVEVSVIDGTVFLGGRVDTENKKIAAAKAASNVPGVKYIRDRIIVNDDVAS